MFHPRSSAFAANVSALEGRLRALEHELERIGRTAGRHTAAGISAAGEEAARIGNEAAKFGAKVGNDALHRMASEVEHRPLVTLAVAVGVGILIGMAGGMAGRRHQR
jgi:hypothetical protein